MQNHARDLCMLFASYDPTVYLNPRFMKWQEQPPWHVFCTPLQPGGASPVLLTGHELNVFLQRTIRIQYNTNNPNTIQYDLTRSSYFHLRRLRAIRRSVSSHVFTSIVHAFVCSRIDYCNSLLVGLPKVRLSPIQSVLNAAARLVGRLPRTSHISA